MADEAGRVGVHPLVEALMPEPDGVPRVTLVGYPGPSTTSDKVRLYTDLSFGRYLEFPAAAVVRSIPSRAADENSPTVVVMDAKTKVDAVTTDRASGDAAFLSGPISSLHYGAASDLGGALGRGGADGGTFATYYTCAPTQNIGCTGVAAVALKTGPITVGYSATCSWIGCLRPGSDIRAAGIGGADMARTGTASWVCQSVNCWPTSGTCLAGAAHAAPTPPTIAGCGTVNLTCGQTGAHYPAAPAAAGCLNMMNTTVCTPTGVPYLCPAG